MKGALCLALPLSSNSFVSGDARALEEISDGRRRFLESGSDLLPGVWSSGPLARPVLSPPRGGLAQNGPTGLESA